HVIFCRTSPYNPAIYTHSLHDALPIAAGEAVEQLRRAESDGNPYSLVLVERDLGDLDGVTLVRQIRSEPAFSGLKVVLLAPASRDRKSTRLNSSHVKISYAVFCLKKKK